MVTQISGLYIQALVLTAAPLEKKRQENARAHQGVPRVGLCRFRGRGSYRSGRCQVIWNSNASVHVAFETQTPINCRVF